MRFRQQKLSLFIKIYFFSLKLNKNLKKKNWMCKIFYQTKLNYLNSIKLNNNYELNKNS